MDNKIEEFLATTLSIFAIILLIFFAVFLVARGIIWIAKSVFDFDLPFWQTFVGIIILRLLLVPISFKKDK
jgi:hypothetical protein